MSYLTLSLPSAQPRCRRFDIRGRTREREANRAVPTGTVEIEAGGDGDTGLVQHPAAEFQAVIGQRRDIGVKIKGTIGWGKIRKPRDGQTIEQQGPVLGIAPDIGIELVSTAEGLNRGVLRQAWR